MSLLTQTMSACARFKWIDLTMALPGALSRTRTTFKKTPGGRNKRPPDL
jgi:hypothetical protein